MFCTNTIKIFCAFNILRFSQHMVRYIILVMLFSKLIKLYKNQLARHLAENLYLFMPIRNRI